MGKELVHEKGIRFAMCARGLLCGLRIDLLVEQRRKLVVNFM